MKNILNQPKGGDLRSIGRADEVVKEIFENPSLFGQLFEGMQSVDPVIRMRSADVIENNQLFDLKDSTKNRVN